MLDLGLSIPAIASATNQLIRGIPVPYTDEDSEEYVAEDGTTAYTTEG